MCCMIHSIISSVFVPHSSNPSNKRRQFPSINSRNTASRASTFTDFFKKLSKIAMAESEAANPGLAWTGQGENHTLQFVGIYTHCFGENNLCPHWCPLEMDSRGNQWPHHIGHNEINTDCFYFYQRFFGPKSSDFGGENGCL